MLRYKLVTADYKTRPGESNETTWRVGETITATGSGGLCTDGVIHSYESPLHAVFLSRLHVDVAHVRLIEIECSDLVADDGLKGGSRSATMTRELPLPVITIDQRAEIAVRIALAIPNRPIIAGWDKWASRYLAGERDAIAAYDAANAARAAARTASYAARMAAYDASYAASYAAANDASNAARAERTASYAASYAAAYAAANLAQFRATFSKILQEVCA